MCMDLLGPNLTTVRRTLLGGQAELTAAKVGGRSGAGGAGCSGGGGKGMGVLAFSHARGAVQCMPSMLPCAASHLTCPPGTE